MLWWGCAKSSWYAVWSTDQKVSGVIPRDFTQLEQHFNRLEPWSLVNLSELWKVHSNGKHGHYESWGSGAKAVSHSSSAPNMFNTWPSMRQDEEKCWRWKWVQNLISAPEPNWNWNQQTQERKPHPYSHCPPHCHLYDIILDYSIIISKCRSGVVLTDKPQDQMHWWMD